MDTKERDMRHCHTVEQLLPELAKCVPLCFNDHTLTHLAMRNGAKGMGIDALIAYVKKSRARGA
jgi:hypothetical protein